MNQENRKIYNKIYYQKNKDRILLNEKEYREKYPEKKKLKDYNWWHNVRDKEKKSKINLYGANRRSRINGKNPSKDGIILTMYEMAERLTKCLGIPFHVDHLIPLSKGGEHNKNNLLPVPANVNLKKKDKIDFSHPYYNHLNLTTTLSSLQ